MENNFLKSTYFDEGIDSKYYELGFYCSLGLSIVLLPICIYYSKYKIHKIKDPKINNSYCVISVYILNV